MLRLTDGVEAAVDDRLGEVDEAPLQLLLSADADRCDLVVAIRASIDQLYVAHEAELERRPDVVYYPGEWDCVPVRSGVLIRVAESDDLQGALTTFVAHLEQRGVAGSLSRWVQPPGREAPDHAPALIARVSVVGARSLDSRRRHRWCVDEAARRRLVDAADAWCRDAGGRCELSLQVGAYQPLAIEADEEVVDRMLDAIPDTATVRLNAATPAGFRSVAVRSSRIVLVEGWTDHRRITWPSGLLALRRFLQGNAADLVCGYVRRGWDVRQGLRDDTGSHDTPRADNEATRANRRGAYDDLVVPDAFGVQLLSPQHTRALRLGPEWEIHHCAGDRDLVVHRDLSAWFAVPFVQMTETSKWEDPPASPIPPVLAKARRDFEALTRADAVRTLDTP